MLEYKGTEESENPHLFDMPDPWKGWGEEEGEGDRSDGRTDGQSDGQTDRKERKK